MQTVTLFAQQDLSPLLQAKDINVLQRVQNYETTLAEYGLDPADALVEDFVLEAGTTLTLGQDPCKLLRRVLHTEQLDEFKRWIGIADELIEHGPMLPPADFPENPWSARLERPRTELTELEWRDIELATNYYLFGDSRLVASYKNAISRHFGPFEAALYAADRVEIMPGATLSVMGYPAILVFSEMVIHQGGNLKLHTPTKMFVDKLSKLSA
jgi:hypothetical protein